MITSHFHLFILSFVYLTEVTSFVDTVGHLSLKMSLAVLWQVIYFDKLLLYLYFIYLQRDRTLAYRIHFSSRFPLCGHFLYFTTVSQSIVYEVSYNGGAKNSDSLSLVFSSNNGYYRSSDFYSKAYLL